MNTYTYPHRNNYIDGYITNDRFFDYYSHQNMLYGSNISYDPEYYGVELDRNLEYNQIFNAYNKLVNKYNKLAEMYEKASNGNVDDKYNELDKKYKSLYENYRQLLHEKNEMTVVNMNLKIDTQLLENIIGKKNNKGIYQNMNKTVDIIIDEQSNNTVDMEKSNDIIIDEQSTDIIIDVKNNDSPKDNSNENDKIMDIIRCCICLENKKNILYMPCAHVSCCKKCSENISACPLCRKPIQSMIGIFL